MSYDVRIIADSAGPNGARITTFQLRFPRVILAEFNTHRAISKSARSSRAVPVARLIAEAESDPFVPLSFGRNRRGMQATEELGPDEAERARRHWLLARDEAVTRARSLAEIGVHKQVVNRVIEPYLWADVVATATTFDNFFALRCHPDAMPEMQALAVAMARAYRGSVPTRLGAGAWHLPFVTHEERAGLAELRRIQAHDWHGREFQADADAYNEEQRLLKLSAARCARVSYRTFDGGEPDPAKDVELHDRLLADGHFSPFEHQARAGQYWGDRSGNFVGWAQYRQTLPRSVHDRFDFATLDEFEGRDFKV